jgi:hypothetical protein
LAAARAGRAFCLIFHRPKIVAMSGIGGKPDIAPASHNVRL